MRRTKRRRDAGDVASQPEIQPEIQPEMWPALPLRVEIGEAVLAGGAGIVLVGVGPFMVIDGWRQGLAGAVQVIMGLVVVPCGIVCLTAATELVGTRRQRVVEARATPTRWLVRGYAARTDRRDVEGLRYLLRELSRADTVGWAALAELSACPALLDGLSFRARRGDLTGELQPFVDAVAAHAATTPGARPDLTLAAALASLDRDGHAREAAVAVMAAEPSPAAAWFLAERTADAVEPVRLRALAAIESLVTADPRRYAPVVRQAAARLGARRWAAALRALAGPAPAERRSTPCCQRRRDEPCFPVLRERTAAEGSTDG